MKEWQCLKVMTLLNLRFGRSDDVGCSVVDIACTTFYVFGSLDAMDDEENEGPDVLNPFELLKCQNRARDAWRR